MGTGQISTRNVFDGDICSVGELSLGTRRDTEEAFAAQNLHAVLRAVEMNMPPCATGFVAAGNGCGDGDQQINS